MLERRVRVRLVVMRRPTAAFSLQPLLQVHFRVSLLLIRTRELAPAHITREWFLTRVRTHMRREVVRSTKRPHADSALERLLSCVNANMPRQLV